MVTDAVPFIANIMMVAHADGTPSAAVLGQLEAIRKEMNFKKTDYNSAVRLVQNGEYKLTPVGSFSDHSNKKIKCAHHAGQKALLMLASAQSAGPTLKGDVVD